LNHLLKSKTLLIINNLFSLRKRGEQLTDLIKDYELKIENIKLAKQNILSSHPGNF